MKGLFHFLHTYLLPLLCAAACLGCFLCYARLSTLQTQLDQLQNTQNNTLQQVQNQMNQFSAQVQSAMEEAQKPILYQEDAWDTPDWVAKTAPYTFRITLKEYDPASTTVTLVVDGTPQPMTLENGTYTYSAMLPITQSCSIEKALIQTGDLVQTQQLDRQVSPLQEMVPYFSVEPISPSASYFSGRPVKCHFQNLLQISPNTVAPGMKLDHADVVLYHNDVEWKRLPVDLSDEGQQNYQKQASKNHHGSLPMSAPSDCANATAADFPPFCFYLDESLSLEKEESAALHLEMWGTNGLRYDLTLSHVEVPQNGSPEFEDYRFWELAPSIYAPDGTLLYEPYPVEP